MKLTLKIKLLPNKEQSVSLLNTIREFNTACNSISETIFEQKIYNQFKVHNLVYHNIKHGRIKMSFVCHNPALIPYLKGEADLLHHKGKFCLYQTDI